jgi:hypothetical protein
MSTQVRRLLTSIINSVKHGTTTSSGDDDDTDDKTSHSKRGSSINQPYRPFSFLGGSAAAGTYSHSNEGSSTMTNKYSTFLIMFDSVRWVQVFFSVALVCGAVALLLH